MNSTVALIDIHLYRVTKSYNNIHIQFSYKGPVTQREMQYPKRRWDQFRSVWNFMRKQLLEDFHPKTGQSDGLPIRCFEGFPLTLQRMIPLHPRND